MRVRIRIVSLSHFCSLFRSRRFLGRIVNKRAKTNDKVDQEPNEQDQDHNQSDLAALVLRPCRHLVLRRCGDRNERFTLLSALLFQLSILLVDLLDQLSVCLLAGLLCFDLSLSLESIDGRNGNGGKCFAACGRSS